MLNQISVSNTEATIYYHLRFFRPINRKAQAATGLSLFCYSRFLTQNICYAIILNKEII
jgi:hypothetical protein